MINDYYLSKPDNFQEQTHLFLDDFAIEDRWDAVRIQNEVIKHPRNPVIIPDQPWELTIGSPSVLYDHEEKRFRMWHGSVHVEVVEHTGRVIEGYTYAECDPNHVDDFDHPVTWKGKNISNLVGRKVYLRFFMRNAFVFGFRFGK